MKIYLAGPMFCAERPYPDFPALFDVGQALGLGLMAQSYPAKPAHWRREVMMRAPWHEYLYPEMVDYGSGVHGHDHADAAHVVPADAAMVREAEALLAYVDRPDRPGTMAEIAMAYALGKPVFAACHPDVFGNNWFVKAMLTEDLTFPSPQGLYRVLRPENDHEAANLLVARAGRLPRSVTCSRCGRPLTDHESVRSGLGPRCAAVLGRALTDGAAAAN
jgi:nucleoside 2-deoxyribosyltransferase